jgi:predicted nuclease of predicted toxin-antitoxin system
VKFLLDTQLPKALAQRLRESGSECQHVLELGLAQSPDNTLWNYAREQDAVIVTKDEDFAEWVQAGRSGPQVVWLRVGNCTNAELLHWLLPLWPQILQALTQGERLIEVV